MSLRDKGEILTSQHLSHINVSLRYHLHRGLSRFRTSDKRRKLEEMATLIHDDGVTGLTIFGNQNMTAILYHDT